MTYDVQPEGSHFVNGKPARDAEGAELPVIYPATAERIALLNEATPAVIEAALAGAEAAWRDWAARPGVERGRVLRRAADILRERNEELSRLETLDTGKPIQETLVADAASAADALEWFGGIAAGVAGEHVQLGEDFGYTRREPFGVCVGIGAWNYPIQIAAWKSAPALACGNAMVFKPSETTPLSALKLAEIYIEAGLPEGLFQVVQGRGAVGAALIEDDRVAKVSLTGSVPTGRRVYEAAARGLKAATMELGGKSPMIVMEDADLDAAVGGAILGNFYSSGQICSNGTRVFVQEDVLEDFLARLADRTAEARAGDPLDPETTLGPLVSEAQLEKVMGHIEAGKAEGARLVCGGTRIGGEGYFVAPTVFADVSDEMSLAREEIFGPVMSVLSFKTEEEALARANATPYGLAAGVFTRDISRAHRMAARLDAGTCWINTYNLTPVELPFGGVKASGVGRENGHAAIEFYSRLKTVYVGMGGVDAPY
ncbi:betaine-aldehyde dehydrogenase [Roseicyclus sp. F158]|uniref:Betaine-aldehyde dehydrogenase n=1 Tax=Tropicimonas omnivorans TaxID=3075590 RepID=A0ABU3DKZ5_9RHOB|nr:betaine-aldehyde dehydrogenase [Roseicyclus sp. F158]MDT0684385.1 betaine-aldehyde dehydrogenase [Roseicyclus sp. F158]